MFTDTFSGCPLSARDEEPDTHKQEGKRTPLVLVLVISPFSISSTSPFKSLEDPPTLSFSRTLQALTPPCFCCHNSAILTTITTTAIATAAAAATTTTFFTRSWATTLFCLFYITVGLFFFSSHSCIFLHHSLTVIGLLKSVSTPSTPTSPHHLKSLLWSPVTLYLLRLASKPLASRASPLSLLHSFALSFAKVFTAPPSSRQFSIKTNCNTFLCLLEF